MSVNYVIKLFSYEYKNVRSDVSKYWKNRFLNI